MGEGEVTDPLHTRKTHGNGCSGWLALCIFACVVGTSFQFGYSTGVINSPGEEIQAFVNASHERRYGDPMTSSNVTLYYALIVAMWAVGGMLGGAVAGKLIDNMGRRCGILVNNTGFVLGALLTTFGPRSSSYEMMIVGRFFTGISAGIATCVAPIYLSEISPCGLRGAIGTLHQIVIVVAIFTSQCLGLKNILGGPQLWPYLFVIPLLPCAVQLLMLPFCPESPSYLFIYRNNYEEATKALQELRGPNTNIDDELRQMQEEKSRQKEINEISIPHLFKDSVLRRSLLIAVMLQLSQQLSGINGVIYYSSSIFSDALGFADSKAAQATLIVTGVLLLMTLISALLVDCAGRRVLHLTGLGGMAVAAAGMTLGFSLKDSWVGAIYLEIATVIAFVMAFAIGPGSIPWFLVSEIFPQSARSAAMSVAVFVNWLANFTIAQTFPFLKNWLKNYLWLPFMVMNVIFFILTYLYVPETKAKSIEEIQREMRGKDGYGTFGNETELAGDT